MDEMNALKLSDLDLKVTNIPTDYKTPFAINKLATPITKYSISIKIKKSSLSVTLSILAPKAPIAFARKHSALKS
jgi:hypothetical protein